ncbi:MAG: nucleotidyltransferase family protein [Solobacterium sp.]|nr:nucleotidyltransferase family protein [Solobacterium sp.]
MKTCGIVAEYNPFHNGHRYHLQQAKIKSEADLMIVVMSGNFVQRGEPAILDKWKRASCAVQNGADIVIELPYLYSTQAASQFAHGAVSLLKTAGVDFISFGSECGNLENLQEIAETSINPDHLHEALDHGMSYPKAYSLLTSEMLPNDILALCYLKEIQGSSIQPVLIQRTSDYLSDELSTDASAMAIREALFAQKDILNTTPMKEDLEHSYLPRWDVYYPYLRTFLLTSSKEQLEQFFLFQEGIENHLKKNAQWSSTWNEFLSSSVTYRYTAGRIRRTCLQAMVQLTKQEVQKLPLLDTLHILAFNENGRKWLHEKRKEDIRIASKFSDIPYPWRSLEYRTSLLYASVFPEEERKEILQKEIQGAMYIRN